MNTEAVTDTRVRVGERELSFRIFDTALSREIVRSIMTGKTYPHVPFLTDVQTVVDVGANVGVASLYFSLQYPGARILAVEPYPAAFALLTGNLAQVAGAEAHGVGLHDHDGAMPLFVSKEDPVTNSVSASSLNGDDSVLVPVRSARAFLREQRVERIDVLKIDTEGCELPILTNLGDMALGARVIYLEYHDESDRLEIDHRLRGTHILYASSIRHPHRGELCYVRYDAFPAKKLDAWRIRAPSPSLGAPAQPAATRPIATAPGMGASAQERLVAAVVIPTILRPSLRKAVASVFAQDVAGRCQLLIGIDRKAGDARLLDAILAEKPDHWTVTVVDPGYSTSVRHGGVHAARDGGALRTILSYLANSPYVVYLDDDNWWAPEHLSSLLRAIAGHDWAYSLRWYVDAQSLVPLCIDAWESIGPGAGIYAKSFGGFVDPNTLMIDKTRCESVLRWWTTPLPDDQRGMSADRHVFRALTSRYQGASTGQASCYYVVDPNDRVHPLRLKLIRQQRRRQQGPA